MSIVHPPAGEFERIQREAIARLLVRFSKIRLVLAPASFIALGFLPIWYRSGWRLGALAVTALYALWRGVIDHRSVKRTGVPGESRTTFLVGLLPITGLVIYLTGGIDSPLWPTIALAGCMLALFNIERYTAMYLASCAFHVWLFTALAYWRLIPSIQPVPVEYDLPVLLMRSVFLTFTLFWGASIGRLMREAYLSMVTVAFHSRDEALQMHREGTRGLTQLTGEIAHELKNPLASVKGLAALIDKDLAPREHERMTVLRREVDRMQEILDSFLNFSRPVVPLDLTRLELRSLSESVVALHEGLSHQRGVPIRLNAPHQVEVKADARKVKQVVINLVQNALEASASGSVIEISVSKTADGGRIDVSDRGAGLDAAELERVFDAGVTHKERGSGLGLTVARMLARQHGGDVKLLARPGGGTVAALALPEAGPTA